MKHIINSFAKQREYKDIVTLLASSREKQLPLLVTGLSEGARQAFYACLAGNLNRQCNSPMLIILPQEKDINRFIAALERYGVRALHYPLRDFELRNITASHEFEHERLSVLYEILCKRCDVVFSTPDAALQFTMPRAVLENRIRKLKISEAVDIAELCAFLNGCGYSSVDMVEASGQFSRRGGIVDIFTPEMTDPVRIEFFGDEIDRISKFDIMSQRRNDDLGFIDILPVREVSLTASQSSELETIISNMAKKAKDDNVKKELLSELEALRASKDIKSIDKYISFVYPERECLIDYFPTDMPIVFQEYSALTQRLKGYAFRENESIASFVGSGLGSGKYIDHNLPPEAFEDIMSSRKNIIVNSFAVSMTGRELSGIYTFVTKQTATISENFELLVDELESYKKNGYKITLLCEGEQNESNIKSMLVEKGYSVGDDENTLALRLLCAPEISGFELTREKCVYLSLTRGERGIRNKKSISSKKTTKQNSAQKILTYSDLHVGDYVVHTVHGIGMYLGLDSLLVAGVRRDFVKIKYAADDMLYLPCNQLDNLSKYIGASEGAGVKLSKMGGAEWQKSKTKVKAAAKAMAKELIALYAERVRKQGFAFHPDDAMDKEFADTFEYDETRGQLDAIEDIRRDMESPWPMDRLLCGDVGYGKTEVALRAAFKAVSSSKQVAILVPTTILALQHYQTIQSRMRGFPVTADMLSRFRTPKQQAQTLRRLERGEIDIVVGTHRILSKDIKFKDLGLVIVDEEQRFGVAQKEKLKQLVKNVDVLTLTATPIPRTLNMAMSGIRDMSILEEAPGDRLPVQSYVCEYDEGIILEAIKKELRRGGQVFYLCNIIDRMDRVASKLSEALPDARIMIANGQMDKEQLSDIWQLMIAGEIDILVCTTIIETGIDVANANTLIIENADRMGLSQLHQLRGRVGRSGRRAYAYFTYPGGRALTEISEKRLEAIKDFTEFGAGFKIAMRDLEIRGAGDLLGAEQHGNIASVGYELYMKLLDEAILEEKGETVKARTECVVDFNIDAYIPESYVKTPNGRIEAYKKISLIRNKDDMYDIMDELIDRYGEPPKAVENLVKVSLLRSMGSDVGALKAEYRGGAVRFHFAALDLNGWSEASKKLSGRLVLENNAKPCVYCKTLKNERVFELAEKILSTYIALCNERNV